MKLTDMKRGEPSPGITKEDVEKFKALVKRELFYKRWYSPEQAAEFAQKHLTPKPEEWEGE